MGWVASLFSALKAEVESLITSLAVVSGTETAVSGDNQQADSANISHHNSDSAPDTRIAIQSLMDQQADSGTADHSRPPTTGNDVLSLSSDVQIADAAAGHPANLLLNADFLIDTADYHQTAQDSDTQIAGSDPQAADIAIPSPLLLNADFLIDTTDHPGPASSPGLTPNSSKAGNSDLSSISAPDNLTMHNQDFQLTPPENGMHSGVPAPNPNVGQFALASLAPQVNGFAQGGSGGTGGTNTGGGYSGVEITSADEGTPFKITLRLDNSLYSLSSSNPGEYTQITTDLQTLVNFLASHFTNNPNDLTHPEHSFLMNVGWGEVGGSALPSGALGGSSYNLYATSYSSLQAGFANIAVANETASGSQAVNIPGSEPFATSNPEFMITAAQKHALNIPVSGGTAYGGVGFSSAANTFYFDPSHPVPGQYDFMGIAAHEISEVLGRVTLNGAKSGNLKEFASLDLFHFSDSNGAPIYSGTTAGYFSVDNGATNVMEFNASSSGDHGDWATNADAFASNPAAGVDLPFSYADYLAMEAAGYSGNFPFDTSTSQTNIDWNAAYGGMF